MTTTMPVTLTRNRACHEMHPVIMMTMTTWKPLRIIVASSKATSEMPNNLPIVMTKSAKEEELHFVVAVMMLLC